MAVPEPTLTPVEWRDNALHLLDQRQLPAKTQWLRYHDHQAVSQAIENMVVRGAPAIGVTAAYAAVLAGRQGWQQHQHQWPDYFQRAIATLASARPTAVNLRWALQQMQAVADNLQPATEPTTALLTAAQAMHADDIAANQQIGRLGAALLPDHCAVLTHCNAGALATGGFGTALGVIRQAMADNKLHHVYVNETRPWLQGARLTAWELMQENIPMTLQADVAAGALMASGELDWIIVGADRIAANGDTANKIGTYSLAVLARHHGLKFMVAAPISTIDWQLDSGTGIPIEQRPASEVTHMHQQPIAPPGVNVSNPAFDVTPASLIDAIVTEAGIVEQPSTASMQLLKEKL